MENKFDEWYFQSDYDLETAVDMFKSGRNVYCIFMCHLSLEKALKGLLIKRTDEFPSKTHSLIYFADKLGLDMSDSNYEFLFMLKQNICSDKIP